MSDFTRYAIYYLPAQASDLASFGASWLGWDVNRAAIAPQPRLTFDLHAATRTPRKYGFHATIKPPFALAQGKTEGALHDALAAFCKGRRAVTVDGLIPSAVGHFLALVPQGDTVALNALAGACVAALDDFRAPLGAADLDRRRAGGLTGRQEALLAQWGYPYVMEEFRFHMTLTGRLDADAQAVVGRAVASRLPELPSPYVIDSLTLVGEGAGGRFQTIQRYCLSA